MQNTKKSIFELFLIIVFLLLSAISISPVAAGEVSKCTPPGAVRCNEKFENWIQVCRDCDIDPEDEWCNTTNCSENGQVCINSTCQVDSDCIDLDHDNYGNGCYLGEDCDDANADKNAGKNEICSDNIDNNCDNQIDCADTDCAADAVCIPVCELASASWSTTNTVEGQVVNLTVTGNNCAGAILNFSVFEKDEFPNQDDPTNISPSSVAFAGNTATASWLAEFQCDGSILGICTAGNPEYYFKAALTSDLQNGISSPINDAGFLHVSQSASASQPEITNPASDSTLAGTTQTFSWIDNGANITNWGLDLSNDSGYSFCAGGTGATCVPLIGQSIEVSGLPVDGNPIRATLWYKENSVWKKIDYQYTAYSGNGSGTATVSWNANTEPDLAGYKIYYGTSPRTGNCPAGGYPNKIDVGNTTSHVFNNLQTGATYYFSVTSYDTTGNESACSSEVSKSTVLPCSLTSAYWQDPKNIQAGQTAMLAVVGQNCDGQTVKFEIFEDEPLLIQDTFILATQQPIIFSGNTATVNWPAEWLDDGFGQGDPEYYFKVALTSNPQNGISSPMNSAGFLHVSRASGGNNGTATVSWNANTESDLAGYKIYYGTSPRTGNCPAGGYPNKIDVGNTTSHVFNNLQTGVTYYFSVTSHDTTGNESACSSEVSKLVQ